MTRQEYVMSVRNFWQWTSTLVHSVKQQWMSESKKFRASATREGGVDPARCTNLQKLPQKRSKQIGNLGGGGRVFGINLQPGKQVTDLGAKTRDEFCTENQFSDWSPQKHQVRCVGPIHLQWIAFTKELTY